MCINQVAHHRPHRYLEAAKFTELFGHAHSDFKKVTSLTPGQFTEQTRG